MSAWYWRVIALKSVFILSCFVTYLRAQDDVQQLPFCNPHSTAETAITSDLVIVSTLDGKLTAFSTQNGKKAWEIETQPLLSSNVHNIELTSGGKWVRLVPSLRGSLYSISGDTIEPLPFDADQLLSSSFKYSDDLVIAGARETQWLGLDVHTGGVIYECGTSGCNGEQTAGAGREVLVLRRHASTVRALDPRSGSEKWNFSVAEHNLALNRRECLSPPAAATPVVIGAAVPDGEVAVKSADGLAVWKQKLQTPLAGVWRLQGGTLQHMDLLFQATRELTHNAAPTLYVGIHCNQLYIQESQLYAKKPSSMISNFKPVPWKVVNARPLLGGSSDTALSILHDTSLSLVNTDTGVYENHGFFLYLQETCDQSVQVSPFEDSILPNSSQDSSHVHIHVYSLWFWWKEVLLIAISSALLMNLMIWPRFFVPKVRPASPLPLNQEVIVVERHYDRPVQNTPEYSGRYENDFTPLRCLGKGGFGVVFEARNNIDHCSYAVKRITLPKRQSKRERVLREVRALAKLEHENIVRYFNAWLETPPPLWQEARDQLWTKDLEGVSLLSEEFTSPVSKPARKDGSVTVNFSRIDNCIDALEFDKKLSEPKRYRSRSCNDSFSIVFDENASKDPNLTSDHTKNSNFTPNSFQITPNSIPKHNGASGDDSFIVFANSNEENGLSEARHNSSLNKHLEKVKECEFTKEMTSGSVKKKKGHTRHWSLDLCVRESQHAHIDTKMYLYIQMQLCQRDNLHDWIRQNRTTEYRYNKVKDLFSQIVAAVEYVHSAGLIHRDLKPSNIFFAPDGRVKVGDFGLVTAMSDTSQDGEPTQEVNAYARHTYRVGTHLYMSPEQLLGQPYNHKVDIFSLGVILFELLHPFGTESERVACLMKVRNGHYPRPFEEAYPNETLVLKEMLSENPLLRPNAVRVREKAPLHGQYST